MRYALILLFWGLIIKICAAQTAAKKISGIAYLGKDIPAAGVVISTPGSEIKCLSGPYGAYSMSIPVNKDTVLASAMGYRTAIVKMRKKNIYNIHLKIDRTFSLKESFREEIALTGTIYDEEHQVIPGTVVSLNGKEITSAGYFGKYSIQVFAGDILTFSFIDRIWQTVIVQDTDKIKDITLKSAPPKYLN